MSGAPYDMGDALAATLAAMPSTESRQRKPEPTPALVVHRTLVDRTCGTHEAASSVSPASVSYQPRSATSACGATGPRSAPSSTTTSPPDVATRSIGPPSRR